MNKAQECDFPVTTISVMWPCLTWAASHLQIQEHSQALRQRLDTASLPERQGGQSICSCAC